MNRRDVLKALPVAALAPVAARAKEVYEIRVSTSSGVSDAVVEEAIGVIRHNDSRLGIRYTVRETGRDVSVPQWIDSCEELAEWWDDRVDDVDAHLLLHDRSYPDHGGYAIFDRGGCNRDNAACVVSHDHVNAPPRYDAGRWEYHKSLWLYSLMLHEIGHCFGLTHDDGKVVGEWASPMAATPEHAYWYLWYTDAERAVGPYQNC